MNEANVIPGGLDAFSAQPAMQPPAAQPPDQPSQQPIDPLTKARIEYDAKRKELLAQQQKLIASLEARISGPQDIFMAMAQGFGAPTRSGSFGESLSNALGGVSAVQKDRRGMENDLAKMRMELGVHEAGMAKEDIDRATKQLVGNLYTITKDESGKETYAINTDVAKRLSEITGDPKYVQQLIADQRQKALKNVGLNIFKPREIEGEGGLKKTVYDFNPNAIFDIMKISDNPLEDISKYSEMIPKLRKAGMLTGMKGDESTPFDALILMAPSPGIKAQAEYYAKQYRNGDIDPEKALTMSNQMLTMATSHMDRQQAQMFNETMQALMFGLRKSEVESRSDANRLKLTDEQKIAYRQQIVPIVNKGQQAIEAIGELDNLESKFIKAPSGVLQGIRANTWGALMGTDENTALREIDSITKRLMTSVPRLPGAQSNFDAQNIEKGLGKLTDPKLTNQQRVEIVGDIKKSYENIKNRAMKVEDYWESNKKVLPLSDQQPPVNPSAAPSTKAPKPLDNVTDADIKFTAKKYNISVEEAKKRLGIP